MTLVQMIMRIPHNTKPRRNIFTGVEYNPGKK